MKLYDRITKDVVLKSDYDKAVSAVSHRDDIIEELQTRNNDLRHTITETDQQISYITTYVDNAPDKKGATLNHYPLTRYIVIHKKSNEIVANLMATRPINTPHLLCIEVGLNDPYIVGGVYKEEK
jgi:hypothetical protein